MIKDYKVSQMILKRKLKVFIYLYLQYVYWIGNNLKIYNLS